jgi:hypothetical protein
VRRERVAVALIAEVGLTMDISALARNFWIAVFLNSCSAGSFPSVILADAAGTGWRYAIGGESDVAEEVGVAMKDALGAV